MWGSVPATLTSLLVNAASMAGLARDDLLRHAGLSDASLADPDGRIPFDQHMRIWDLIAASDSIGPFGLRLGTMSRPQDLGVVGYAALHAPSVREAHARMTRFRRLVHDLIVPEFSLEGDHAVIHQVMTPDLVKLRHPAEASLS